MDSNSESGDSNFGLMSDDDFEQSVSSVGEEDKGTDSDNEKTIDEKPEASQPPLSTELVEFNKLVISMRPLLKKAKVQFINNTTRQIRKIKAKKGTQEQMEKNEKKAERMAKEIAYINRLKKDVVAKFALLHSKEELAKIVISKDSTMEYRVKAKVASMPAVSKVAEKYHSDHPNWAEELFKIIQLVGKNMKRKRRKMRGIRRTKKGDKPVTDQAVPSKKTKEKNMIKVNDEDSQRFDHSNFPEPPADLEQLIGKNSNSYSRNDSSIVSNPLDGTISEYDIEDSCNMSPPKTIDQLNQKTTKNIGKRQLSTNEKSGSKRPKLNEKKPPPTTDLQLDADSKSDNIIESSLRKSGKSLHADVKPIARASVDPFFMTSDDKAYKTYCKVEPADSSKPSNKEKSDKVSLKKLTPFTDLKKGKINSRNGFKDKPPSNESFSGRETSKSNKKRQAQQPVKVEELHPSWQAKKKLQIVNAPFQGKKIVFDD